MNCNACWQPVEPKTKCIASSCGHLFCLGCAENLLGGAEGGTCPICEALITKSSVKLVNVLQDSRACQLNLCGQTPDTALSSALASVKFYMQQQELESSLRQTKLESKLQRVQEACKKKLQEVHNGYLTAKRKYQEILEAKNALEADNEELKLKYQTKAQQTRKHVETCRQLQEACERLQQENRMLRGQGAGNQMGRMSPYGRNAGLPEQPQGRHPGQVVTTVHHKQVFLGPHQQNPNSSLSLRSGGNNPAGFGGQNLARQEYASPHRIMDGMGGTNNLNLGGNGGMGTSFTPNGGARGMMGSQPVMQSARKRPFLGGVAGGSPSGLANF